MEEDMIQSLPDRYVYLSTLGSGVAAHTIRVLDNIDSRVYALKIFVPGRDARREYDVMERLGPVSYSPVVIRLESIGEYDALVLEYVPGSQVLKIRNLDYPRFRDILVQISIILDDLRQKGFYYGDLHLGNLLFTDEAEVKLIDYGESCYTAEGPASCDTTPAALEERENMLLNDTLLTLLYSLKVIPVTELVSEIQTGEIMLDKLLELLQR